MLIIGLPSRDAEKDAGANGSSATKYMQAAPGPSAAVRSNVESVNRYNAYLWSQRPSGLSRDQSRAQYLAAWTNDWNGRSG